jgi:hypothetical protein
VTLLLRIILFRPKSELETLLAVSQMKHLISTIILSMLFSLAHAGGEGVGGTGGGNGGSGNTMTRLPASNSEMDEVVSNEIDAYGSSCLKTLKSTLTLSKSDSDFRKRLNEEIFSKLNERKKNNLKLDTVNFPECFAYARETNNEELKSLLVKKRIPASDGSIIHDENATNTKSK